ncbi:MAG: DUF424 domain-containing protein [Methanomicrobiales archaeon]|nr:DUF424 domain-containing protein [Methanomicrobiales archaeon]
MFLKIHRSPRGDVVAACDRELIGKRLTQDGVEIVISESFYGSTPASEEEVRRAMQDAGNVNLMGERVVRIAIEMELISEKGCIIFGGVPHAQIFRV